MRARIIERPAFQVIGLERPDAPPEDIGQLWERFLPRSEEISGRDGVPCGLCLHRPNGELGYLAGYPVKPGTPVPDGMTLIDVPAGRYAVFTHVGSTPDIALSFQVIHDFLLAERGLEASPGICFEEYGDGFHGPQDPKSETLLWVPVF
ncbi:GyrI-like domain-containing protein [Metapseudomonas otitidis]|uniref:GyrI-like domain-containing protein n=1 Tax=Metapseudomonas otitidis TaxID=319939 RepID=UPI001AAF940D|nr:GyrI-like domain-containing protein [Pseudomonas otitidis]MBO2928407.1 AraC family transcriptional regulator [Pseudomonas otitidis]